MRKMTHQQFSDQVQRSGWRQHAEWCAPVGVELAVLLILFGGNDFEGHVLDVGPERGHMPCVLPRHFQALLASAFPYLHLRQET